MPQLTSYGEKWFCKNSKLGYYRKLKHFFYTSIVLLMLLMLVNARRGILHVMFRMAISSCNFIFMKCFYNLGPQKGQIKISMCNHRSNGKSQLHKAYWTLITYFVCTVTFSQFCLPSIRN